MPLTQRVAAYLGMRTGLACARGSAALYALLATLARRDGPGEVIIPALCCESVALAAAYAGHALRFAEVSSESLCMTPETVAPLLSERTRAVIVVHLYGVDADAGSFASLRRECPQAVFVEDIAQALGGRGRDGRLLGGAMDYALLSFADNKIIAGDGGMLLFGSGTLDSAEVAAALPAAASRMPQPRLALSLRNLVHGLADLRREQPAAPIDSAFRAVLNGYRDLIVCSGGIADERAVAAAFDELDHNRAVRYRNYIRYRSEISTKRATVISMHENSTCWRCPVLFDDPGRARAVTDALRVAGIHASNHYFPLNLLIGGERKPVSEDLSARVVNLWTEERTPSTMIESAIHIINHFKH